MARIPDRVAVGDLPKSSTINSIIECLQAIWPQPSGYVFPQVREGGTTFDLRLPNPPPPKTQPTPQAVILNPFQIYQVKAGDPTSDWRTVRVAQGTVNNVHPTGDGSASYSDDSDANTDNSTIILPASATTLIWLECAIVTDAGNTQGTLDSSAGNPVTIKVGADGWDGYPAQPDGDATTGNPPDALYILLGSVTTGVDDHPTDPTYHKLTLPNPQPVTGSQGVGMTVFAFDSDPTTGWIILRRLLNWRVS